jgi:uncharacterized protein (TIGR02444 family)
MSDETPLWRFAVAFYGSPSVARLCVDWQDRRGVDVPRLLVVIWLAATGRRADPPTMDALATTLARWRVEVVAPLRAARRALKRPSFSDADPDLRPAVAVAELAAEKAALAAAWALVWRLPDGPARDPTDDLLALLAEHPGADPVADAAGIALLRDACGRLSI